MRERVDVGGGPQGDLRAAAYVVGATKGADALLWIVPESFTAADPIAEMALIGANGAAAIRR